MAVSLTSFSEKQAEKAETLPAFRGFSLQAFKQKVADLLRLIEQGEIFDLYTKHHMTQIDSMLHLLEWLIPENTQSIMSPADWLLIVLAIYFHDFGLLVTKKEFELRNLSGFPEFRDNILFAGDGEDYRIKVEQEFSDHEEVERFLYQEFVRYKHAERIRTWITDAPSVSFGDIDDTLQEIHQLLKPLSQQFRRDLAMVCESHHFDDLNDFKKYNVSRPYGNSDEETANLQYAAALLRSVDLLDIVSDRTPSIVFRIINPTDPLGQEEWVEQQAVTRVRPKIGYDSDGKPDERASRDTIEVFARFFDESGFFGLTSYLSYVSAQMRKIYDWVREANYSQGTRYNFPWRYVDDSNIETEGFIRETFQFIIDQAKSLDLLTGHVIYNDTNVVIRELVKNSIDAIRLQRFQDPTSEAGKVQIHWNTKDRVLSIEDNGTGMTQEIIERFLLVVGRSRYQDVEFLKSFPGFPSISRFGIGFLSAFMIADTVEVITCVSNEDLARHISLRSVHGKYLIQLLDKQNDEVAKHLAPHGTCIRLRIRPSVRLFNVIEVIRKWVVVPDCEVFITVDNAPPVQIGFPSPKDALIDLLQKMGLVGDKFDSPDEGRIRVEQKEMNGTTLAYALQWSEFFHEWTFLTPKTDPTSSIYDLLLGICIEGIRVEFDTPGFKGKPIVAIANIKGPRAPKTNVAWSSLEISPEYDVMLLAIYSIYATRLNEEMQQLHSGRAFSLMWSVEELKKHLLPQLFTKQVLDPNLLLESVKQFPMLLIERNGVRQASSLDDLKLQPFFWTIDSPYFQTADRFIREVPGDLSLQDILSALDAYGIDLPEGPILCGFTPDNPIDRAAFKGREIDTIKVLQDQRRVDLLWVNQFQPPCWISLQPPNQLVLSLHKLGLQEDIDHLLNEEKPRIVFGQERVKVLGLENEIAIRVHNTNYMLPGTSITNFITSLFQWYWQNQTYETFQVVFFIVNFIDQLLRRSKSISMSNPDESFREQLKMKENSSELQAHLKQIIALEELYELLRVTKWGVFDPFPKDRKD